MKQDPVPKPDKPLDAAIRTLVTLTNADDLRWLSAYIAIEKLNQRSEIRGIGYGIRWSDRVLFPDPDIVTRLHSVIEPIAHLSHDDLVTFRLVVDLLYKALRPVAGEGRGYVQVKKKTKKYPEIDRKTGLQEIDDHSNPIFYIGRYSYVYVRLYAGKGDGDHKRAKLLSFYADRGSGKTHEGGGFGGYVAKALEDGLTTEDKILDAWRAGKPAYDEFMDGLETMVKILQPPAPDQLDSFDLFE